ncbi:MAG TPA: ABC transporter permease [Firmicutes bacterium]|jgi:general nucleoside transport system permease protein|nr:ABC transporter permease [Bacillota bacterium]
MKLKLEKNYLLALVAVALGLLAGALLMAVTGNNPFEGYYYLFRGGLMSVQRIGDTLATATPLILTGLSVAFAFKTGLFNIGAPGQMLIGGLCATAVGLSFAWPKPVLLPAVVIAAILGGALWGIVPGWLKARFNVHEVVSSIMMNWIAYWAVYYIIPGYFKGQYLETESKKIPMAASLKMDWFTNLFNGSYINMGFFLALFAVILMAFILNKTTLGYELKAVGFNRHAAESAGIVANRGIVLSMMIAGALAGLAGAAYYVGYASSMQIGVSPSQGFDGIAVSLLGLNSPWGVFAAAIFFGVLQSGKGFMNAMTSIPPEIADTIIATIIYFAATNILIERAWERIYRRKEKKHDRPEQDTNNSKADQVGGLN